MLKRKQASSNDEWIKTFRNIEAIVTKDEIDTLVNKTVHDIKKTCRGKDAAFAWSGGKDSIALAFVCELAGIKEAMCAVCDLEYPAFKQWIHENKPERTEIINTGQDLDWLAKNQHMLFPDNRLASRWYAIVQHKGQRQYTRQRKVDILILGRRKADGNYVGKRRGENTYEDREGFTRFSPLADWRHEDVLAVIHYYSLKMPPIYKWPDGFKTGTHPWPARPYTTSVQDGWRQIYEIDPTIVKIAASKINSAKHFLEVIEHEN